VLSSRAVAGAVLVVLLGAVAARLTVGLPLPSAFALAALALLAHGHDHDHDDRMPFVSALLASACVAAVVAAEVSAEPADAARGHR
jgi:undecaprenyl pyrophosphate phosphatase UppP